VGLGERGFEHSQPLDHNSYPATMIVPRRPRPHQERTPRKRRWRLIVGIVLLSPVALYAVAHLTVSRNYTVPTGSMEPTVLVGDRVSFMRTTGGMPERGEIITFDFPGTRDQTQPLTTETHMGRCIAVAGDTVQIVAKNVTVNGRAEQSAATTVHADATVSRATNELFPPRSGFTRDDWGPMRVPKRGDVIPLNDSTYDYYRTFIEREGHTIHWNDDSTVTLDGRNARSYTVEKDYLFSMGDNRDRSFDSRFWGFVPVDAIVCTGGGLVIWSKAPDSGFRWNRTFTTVR